MLLRNLRHLGIVVKYFRRRIDLCLPLLVGGIDLKLQALQLEMRADNARLAAAIEAEHDNGPQVVAAITRSHEVMGEVQIATLGHIFAMRKVLRPEQADKFDRAVVQALTADVR